MRPWTYLALGLLLALLTGCGGGNSTETTLVGPGGGGVVSQGQVASVDQPTGPNTADLVVDTGPSTGFALGVANVLYTTVTICEPGSATACVTVDHVLVDTGSIGLRLLRSSTSSLKLPAQTAPNGREVAECYPFVVGAIWGPVARADVRLGGELASELPVQLIDDATPQRFAAPPDCVASANGSLLASVTSLQANGILGLGQVRYDCGLRCQSGNYVGSAAVYDSCSSAGCQPTALPTNQQVAQPVARFAQNNNGTLIILPKLPATGVAVAKGRLVFGIGTQSNNQLETATQVIHLGTDPAAANYLYLTTTVDGQSFGQSYVDSGSNAFFFADASLSSKCAGGGSRWYCPSKATTLSARLSDSSGASASVSFDIVNADGLFGSGNVAFSNLGASTTADVFVWGLPFFYGRKVYTSIWGQPLAADGPWIAF
jgi:hypothetical protein